MPTFDLLLPPQPYVRWRPTPPAAFHPIPRVGNAVGVIAQWIDRVRQRQALAGLDDRMLRDIGITRVEAARECEKPFWR